MDVSSWFRKQLERNWSMKEVGAMETTIRDTLADLSVLSTRLMEIGMRLDDPIDQIEIDECRDLLGDVGAKLMKRLDKNTSN